MTRLTRQFLLPESKTELGEGYDLYPTFPLRGGSLGIGYQELFEGIRDHRVILLDGYVGVDWSEVQSSLKEFFVKAEIPLVEIDMRAYYKSEDEILELISPFLGGEDPIFGHKTNLDLVSYLNLERLSEIKESDSVTLVYGSGASLCGLEGLLVYFDLPKNELQYRMRSKSVANLGFSKPKEANQAYKHFYFVDWVMLNKEKQRLIPKIDLFVDQQRPNQPIFTSGDAIRRTFQQMAQGSFRVRPWFEPGVWGGNWMKNRFNGLNTEVPNYAWSFEMIVPENGLILEDRGLMLELSFDFLMYLEGKNVLGKAFDRFQTEFPIRFDFLDTYDGGNLSVQCHPSPAYIKEKFGENFTQDETYYILDAEEGAEVYLGFQEDIDPEKFKNALEDSLLSNQELDIEAYVQKLPSEKHALYLIPHGTVHCSGKNNLVLEISATPYIYTFKIYDWQRLDLNGIPRPLNIDRAMDNLNFDRKGKVVTETLISKPVILDSGKGWNKIQLPTHSDHFYDVIRYEFENEIKVSTGNQCHLLMLVEGTEVELSVENQQTRIFHFAETFAVSAAAKTYVLTNKGKGACKVVVSYVKDEAC